MTPTGPLTVEVLRAEDAEASQRRAAGALLAAGLVPGDRVAFCLHSSSAALLCAVLGALRVGVVPVLLNATLLESERDLLIADAQPGMVITDAAQLASLDGGAPADLAPHPLARPMHYTSGTTGRSKGVWSGLWDVATARAALADEADQWCFGPDDVHLVCSPMYHSVSVRFAGGTLLSGGTCVVLGRFDPSIAWQVLRGECGAVPTNATPTTTFMAPTALRRLLDAGDDRGEPLDSLRLLVHAGSPCPAVLKRRALERVHPGVLWEFYGSTEGQFTACSPEDWLARPGTVGRARAGRSLTVDGDGTVWCHSPGFARFTYWRNEAATAAAWRDDAFTVGDLGRLEDGFLFLDGRREDLIITGGVNVYPAEVEQVLGEVEGVAEAAVFGLADEEWGQRVCAAVVPTAAPGSPPASRLLDEVAAFAATRLAGYKRPKQYVVMDKLPRTATGKLQRSRIPGQVGLD
ncbi:MAG: class I adenylate-forming enzyme family protein [Acidimicrobiales bacterium]